VLFDRLGGVAECLRDDRNRGQLGELVQGTEPGGLGPKTNCNCSHRLEARMWRPGVKAREHPVRVRVGCGATAPGGGQLPERLIEWFRQLDAGLADSDRDDLIGDHCVIPGLFDDAVDPLGKHEHEDCCGSVPGG